MKQTAELANRKMQTEMKTREQSFIKLNADLNEMQLQLEAEKNARTLQVNFPIAISIELSSITQS